MLVMRFINPSPNREEAETQDDPMEYLKGLEDLLHVCLVPRLAE